MGTREERVQEIANDDERKRDEIDRLIVVDRVLAIGAHIHRTPMT